MTISHPDKSLYSDKWWQNLPSLHSVLAGSPKSLNSVLIGRQNAENNQVTFLEVKYT